MKKFLEIIVIYLLLSGAVLAKEIILECDNYRVIGYFKAGGKTDEPGSNELDTLFKVDTSKEKVFAFNGVGKKFIEEKNTKWSDDAIEWERNWGSRTNYHTLNRYTLEYKKTSIYSESDKWKRLELFSKCKVAKKKF